MKMPNDIQILICHDVSGISDTLGPTGTAVLPQERAAKCESYNRKTDRELCIAAFLLLEKGLHEFYGISEVGEFRYSDFGKPYLVDYPNVFFNISHTGAAAACALSEMEIGLDIQDFGLTSTRIVNKACTAVERSHLYTSSNPTQDFVRLWVKKESYAKYKGLSVAEVLGRDLPECDYFEATYSEFALGLSAERGEMAGVQTCRAAISGLDLDWKVE